jgi:hypothetical protein
VVVAVLLVVVEPAGRPNNDVRTPKHVELYINVK